MPYTLLECAPVGVAKEAAASQPVYVSEQRPAAWHVEVTCHNSQARPGSRQRMDGQGEVGVAYCVITGSLLQAPHGHMHRFELLAAAKSN
jgi:hypothetical protein